MAKKSLLVLAILLLGSIAVKAQLLYEITGNGLKKSSYIIGTHHLANISFAEKIPGVKEALEQVEQVYGEVKMADMYSKDTIAVVTAATMLPENQTLKTILTPEQFTKVDNYVASVVGQALSSQMLFSIMGKLNPTSLYNQLTILMYMKKHPNEFNPTKAFDQYFQDYAVSTGKTVGGLETVADQIKTLYSTPLKRQIEELMCMVDNQDYYMMQMEDVTKSFYAMDLAAIEKAFDEKLQNSCDATDEEQDILIYNRNRAWLKKMPEIMASKPTFFAVGSGHLFGEKGVLNLLRQAGYEVKGVK